MSYIKSNEIIKFAFSKNAIFDRVSLETTYMTKNLQNKNGENISEEYALSEDERDAFNLAIEQVLPKVFEIFLKQTSGIVDAFKQTTVEGNTTIEISINDHQAYNANVLSLVDKAIEDCIVSGCEQVWFETVVHPDLIALTVAKNTDKVRILNKRLFQLKKMRVYS